MLVTVDANNSAWQSCTRMSSKPEDSARTECRAADGPVSARMHITGEQFLSHLSCFGTGLAGAAETQ